MKYIYRITPNVISLILGMLITFVCFRYVPITFFTDINATMVNAVYHEYGANLVEWSIGLMAIFVIVNYIVVYHTKKLKDEIMNQISPHHYQTYSYSTKKKE